jgi:hypothetical protein
LSARYIVMLAIPTSTDGATTDGQRAGIPIPEAGSVFSRK